MNMKAIVEGLELIQKGITSIIDEVQGNADANVAVKESTTSAEKTVGKSSKTDKKPDKKIDSADGEYTKEELDGMTYNDLKKLAKELGISAVGNRKEITEKILSGEVSDDESEDEEVKSSKKTVSKGSKKLSKKPVPDEDEEDEDEPEEDDEDEDEEDVDPVEQQVLEVTEEMSDDDIREVLEDCGVSTKGKRQALIAKLVKAVKDGKIDLDASDDSEDEDVDIKESDEDSAEEDITANMTKKRKKAYIDFCKETEESFEDGEITREELIEFINNFNDTKDKMKKVSDEDLVKQYLELSANLIDDDGEIIEEGAYTINDEPYCCGRPLKYDEDENKFICEVCGEEYEGEE